MIDWQVKVHELKQTADELDLWAAKSDGRQRTVLGRIADELRQFGAQIQQELVPVDAHQPAEVPDWLVAIVEPSADVGDYAGGEDTQQYYLEDEEHWEEDEEVSSDWDASR